MIGIVVPPPGCALLDEASSDIARAKLSSENSRCLTAVLHLRLQGREAGAILGAHLRDMLAVEILQQRPVLAALFDQFDDGVRNADLDQALLGVGRVDERRLAGARRCGQIDELFDRHRAGNVGPELEELLLETDFTDREVRRRQHRIEQLQLTVVVEILEWLARPGFFRIGIAVEREPVVQRLAAPRVVHEDRTHAAFHRQTRLAGRRRIADTVLALARRVDIKHRRRVGIGEERHRVLEEVPLQRGTRRADEDVGVERRDQPKLLACLVLAIVGGAVTGEVGILADEARRRRLAAGIRVGAGVEHQHLERRAAGEDARERAEADVVGRAVTADGHHRRQQVEFGFGELVPSEQTQLRVVGFRHVGVADFEFRRAQGAHVDRRLCRNALENALGQRLRVLEQAIDPGIVVGVEREGRGVNAAATGRVGDDRARWTVAGGAAFEQVKAFFERGDQFAEAFAAHGVVAGQRFLLGGELLDQAFEFGDVVLPALLGNRMVGRHHQTNRGDFAAATATTVATGGRVVVGTVKQQALDFAARLDRTVTKRAGVFGVLLMNWKRFCRVPSNALS